MNKHLDIHNKVLESSVKALEYAQKKARKLDTDIPEDNVLLLDKLEHKASEQNVLFCLYQEAKKQYRVRPTNDELKTLANSGELTVGGLELSYNRDEKKAFINGVPVYSEPLLEAGERPTDVSIIRFSHQRQNYLTESIVNQRSFINHDSKGRVDAFGNEINNQHDVSKAKEALKALKPDPNNINPNGLFLTNLTAQQKVRAMLFNINESKDKIRSLSKTLTSNEVNSINKTIQEQHQKRAAHDVATGKISPLEALNRPTTHVLDKEHNFVKNNLSDIEGLNDTSKFPLNYIRPIPKGYITVKEHLDKLLQAPYDLGDDEMSAIAKQMIVFDDTKKALSGRVNTTIDFSDGIDKNKLYVTTNKISHGQLYEGESAVMDSDGRISHVSSGEFGITKSGTLRKDFGSYDAVILSVGALASGSLAKAVEDNPSKGRSVLVIDALDDANLTDVLSNIRDFYRTPVAVFTDNKDIQNHLNKVNDKHTTSYLSDEHKWGELGIGLLREGAFDKYQKAVEEIVEDTISQSKATSHSEERLLSSSPEPDILLDDVDKNSKIDNDNSSNQIKQSTQTRNKGLK